MKYWSLGYCNAHPFMAHLTSMDKYGFYKESPKFRRLTFFEYVKYLPEIVRYKIRSWYIHTSVGVEFRIRRYIIGRYFEIMREHK